MGNFVNIHGLAGASGKTGTYHVSDEASSSLARNPIVYFLITDRFHSSRPAQCVDKTDLADVGTFHGGTFGDVTKKLREGWFSALGVNALWISAPYEQIQGWVPGACAQFRHFAYHGYWALDYTVTEPRLGTREEFGAMVDAAHAAGIKVVLDVVISHPGYPDHQTISQYMPGALRPRWQQASIVDYDACLDRTHVAFADWWGTDWIAAPGTELPDGVEELGYDLPRFRVTSKDSVTPPRFFQKKPATKVSVLPNTTVRGYLITWLTDWVREFGIDGFRCDSAKHVDLETWRELKCAATAALEDWKERHPEKKVDSAPFWMVGEVYGNGIERNVFYDNGFDSLINFQFQNEIAKLCPESGIGDDYLKDLMLLRLDALFERYARVLSGATAHSVLSYISSHDTRLFDQDSYLYSSAALMLAPGGVQIFYGDESGRQPGPCPAADPTQAARSDMNWESIDHGRLEHWRRLGRFRSRHVAIARGRHRKLSEEPYVFSRTDAESGDCVIVTIGYTGELTIDVGPYFSDGTVLFDAYTLRRTTVDNGRVVISVDDISLLAPE